MARNAAAISFSPTTFNFFKYLCYTFLDEQNLIVPRDIKLLGFLATHSVDVPKRSTIDLEDKILTIKIALHIAIPFFMTHSPRRCVLGRRGEFQVRLDLA
jgi:hypothetical protein